MRPKDPRGRPSDSSRIERVKRLVQANLAQPVTLTDAARIADLSASYFCTLFRRETGTRFKQWLRATRVRRAMELLHERTVREAAREVGYETLRTFERAFKSQTSLSPREFKRTLAAVDRGRSRGAGARPSPGEP